MGREQDLDFTGDFQVAYSRVTWSEPSTASFHTIAEASQTRNGPGDDSEKEESCRLANGAV